MPWFWGNKTGSKNRAPVVSEDGETSPVDRLVSVHQSALLEVTEHEKYECRVHDFTNIMISLTAPLDDLGHPVLVPAGTQVRVVLQVGRHFYGFNTRVLGPKVVNNIPLLDVKKPQRVERTDRREYYRVPVDLALEFRLNGEDAFRPGRAVDMSGGGILCLLPRNIHLQRGSELEIRMALPNVNMSIEARLVVRQLFEPPPRSENRRVACEFIEIQPRTREAIIRYVAQRQLELIRAGMLH